ncbi:hypothetical protein [Alishewanella longhuensis]
MSRFKQSASGDERLKIALLQQEGELKQIRIDKSARDKFWFGTLAVYSNRGIVSCFADFASCAAS